MKLRFLFLFVCFFTTTLYAQNTRGLSAVETPTTSAMSGKTYALVVGISKYKDPAIHALQYADKDAQAFYEYLRATGVDSTDMILLLNEKATSAQFWSNLQYVVELSKQGDKVLVYFSGHGDVESKTAIPEGFLLPYDVPRAGYMPFAIPISVLKNYVSGMSVKGVQIIFISDACHSGNLAGGLAGMEATANLLKDKWKDEVKMLSCQPKELSLEGKQWGGGRGLFSYELINGMAGKADKNKDGKVTLRELNLYLMEKVPEGASPAIQNPELEGSPEYVISIVNEKLLDKINNSSNANTAGMLAMTDARGFDESMLNGMSADIRENYKAFKSSLDSGNYADYPDEQIANYYVGQSADSLTLQPSALYYLQRMPVNENTHILVSYMKRNLSAAMMEDIGSDIGVDTISLVTNEIIPPKVQKWLKEIENNANENITLKNQELIMKYAELNVLSLQILIGSEKMKELGFYSKYILSLAKINLSLQNRKGLQSFLPLVDSAIRADSFNARLHVIKGATYMMLGNKNKAIECCKNAMAIAPTLPNPYLMLTNLYFQSGRYDTAILYAHKSIEYSHGQGRAFFLGKFVLLCVKGTIEIDSMKLEHVSDSLRALCNSMDNALRVKDWGEQAYYGYSVMTANICCHLKLYDKTLFWFDKYDEEKAKNAYYTSLKYFGRSVAFLGLGKKIEGISNFKTALEKGYNSYNNILESKELDAIRNEPEYIALMKKHFPDKYK